MGDRQSQAISFDSIAWSAKKSMAMRDRPVAEREVDRFDIGGAAMFERLVASAWPVAEWRDCHVVLAVSGGADSVALLRATIGLKNAAAGAGRLFVAHLDHGLRGDESAADAKWLAELCESMALPCELGTADVRSIADSQGDGWEAAARSARSEFLLSTAERLGARFVATAHTADDQVETVVHRIIRGTGIAGLAGIPTRRALSPSVTLVRPMLQVRRDQVVEYLAAIGQDYRIDSSNDDSRFTRNRLRHELLPLLRDDFNSDVDAALTRLATQAAEIQTVLSGFADELAGRVVEFECQSVAKVSALPLSTVAQRLKVDCSQLLLQPAIVVREVFKSAWREAGWPLQAMGFDEWQLLALLAKEPSRHGALNLPGNIIARWDDDLLMLERRGLS